MYPQDEKQEAFNAQRNLAVDSHRYEDDADADRIMSSSERAMIELEQNLMALDEEISVLTRKLRPVISELVGKTAEGQEETRKALSPQSPLSSSIIEKSNRVMIIRNKVRSISNSIDL